MKRSTKIVAAVAAGTAAAAAAAARVVARTNDVPATPAPIPDPVLEPDVDGDAFLDHLGQAIRLRTVSHEDHTQIDTGPFHEFHEFLAEVYPLTHEHCDVEVVNDLSLLATWHGSDPEVAPIVLMAHIDVVPVEEGTEADWTVSPFSGEVRDDRLWGRGALDDKGSLVAILEAVEHLLSTGFTPRRTVHLAFGHDEEIGGTRGAVEIARTLRDRGVRPWLLVDEGGGVVDSLPPIAEGPIAMVKVAEKGAVSLRLTARDAGGHSSMPPSSTAAGTLAAALASLEANPMPPRTDVVAPLFAALAPRLDPRIRPILTNLRLTGLAALRMLARTPATNAMIRTTMAITMLEGGVKPNVLPQEASAVVNVRILPGDSIPAVIDHVRTTCGSHIGIEVYGDTRSEPPTPSSTDSDAWHLVHRIVSETFPDALVAPWTLIGATDSRHYVDIAEHVYGFAPLTVAEGFGGIHGTDEYVRAGDADRAVSFFARLIREAQDA